MPRRQGSLNKATIDKMVADGELCLLSQRLNCVKCREARARDESLRVQTRMEAVAAAIPADPLAPAVVLPVGPTEAMILDTFIEYKAPDGKDWRIERGMDLLTDFSIQPAHVRRDIGAWHAALAAQEQVWLIVRRIYGVAPMLGTSDPDDLRAWPVAELGAKLGLPVEQIEAALGETKLFWARYRAASKTDRKGVKVDTRKAMLVEEVDEVIARYDFGNVVGDAERRYAAKRCVDLEPYLENETGRPIARSAIQQELLIFYVLDARIAQHQAKVAQSLIENPKMVSEDKENARLIELMEARAKANKGYEETMKTLGATQVQTGSITKRVNFHLSLGTIFEAYQQYYAGAGNDLIDGFATEAEVELVIREKDLPRPNQYRPDIVIAWEEAMNRLWDKNYEPTPIGRARVRKLRTAFAASIRSMLAEEGEVLPPLNEDELGEAQSAAAPAAPSPAGLAESAGPAIAPVMGPPRARNGDNDIAVF